ncbi:hypothetical protein F8M41_003480 [Gigaspora margarita]|uniref:Uncharacterized protein n=1 Tax=Gigaspora margarita TaxID=4874 RepID=A0A8H3XCN7_GIGMA|nr:hypothetical protein F8M41_003480 [Gigaspora margarita]
MLQSVDKEKKYSDNEKLGTTIYKNEINLLKDFKQYVFRKGKKKKNNIKIIKNVVDLVDNRLTKIEEYKLKSPEYKLQSPKWQPQTPSIQSQQTK